MRQIQLRHQNADGVGSFQAMGGPCEVICEGLRDIDAIELAGLAAAEAWRIEDAFSRYRDDNIVHAINTAGGKPVQVDDEAARLIEFAVTLHGLSDGRFDITSGVLRQAWTFDGSANVPGRAAIDEIMDRVGWHRVEWNPPTLTMPAGMEIDFGGIGKEYAVDRAAQILHEASDTSCLVNFGGDLAMSRPPRVHTFWSVGIEAVDSMGEAMQTVIQLRAGAIATSGDARRFLIRDGRRFGHILDPTTGWPVEGAPRSITVAADTCVEAGMLSTLAMLEGKGAEAYLDAQDVRYWCYR